MNEPRSGGFLGRWSRLKADARQGIEPPSPAPETPSDQAQTPTPQATAQAAPTAAPPAPSLEDVAELTPESDFRAFVGSHVSSDVKNAAMKKLFTDPHFNVMDGLDVYIDDYSQPDPLAPAMLRQMASAKFMKLVDEEPDATATPPQTVAQSAPKISDPDFSATDSSPIDHDHTDLRLQPDPAARRPGPGESPA